VNPGAEGQPDLQAAARDFTGEDGFGTVIDATGSPAVIESLTGLVAHNGELILLGTPRGEYRGDMTGFLRAQHLAKFGLIVKGAHEVRCPTWKTPFLKHSRQRNAERIITLIRKDSLKVKPLVTKIVSPEAAQDAYDTLIHHGDMTESIVFDFSV
jgi:threonine dehydrogenase-like Zn-dependent dehydrogenase